MVDSGVSGVIRGLDDTNVVTVKMYGSCWSLFPFRWLSVFLLLPTLCDHVVERETLLSCGWYACSEARFRVKPGLEEVTQLHTQKPSLPSSSHFQC